MPSTRSVSIHRFSAGAVAGPMVLSDTSLSELPPTTIASPVSAAFQVSRYILLPPRHGQNVGRSGLPLSSNDYPECQQSKSVIRKANVLANWTSSTHQTSPSSGIVTRSPPFPSTRSLYSTRPESPTLSSSESCSSTDCSRSSTPSRPSFTSPMANTYFPLHLSAPDPLRAVFKGPDGRALFSTSTEERTTVIRRLYGRSAKTTKQKQDGLVLAEIEWTDRVRSSRIRFKGVDVDVRIDEYLKETRGGSGQSRMFATSDGRTYKWKAICSGGSAELFECASGKRISGLLASSNPSPSPSASLPTPPPTPPIILSPSATHFGAAPSPFSPAAAGGFEVPSISLSEPETRQEGEKPTLRVHTSVLNLVDQIIVTWVIMERDRMIRKKN